MGENKTLTKLNIARRLIFFTIIIYIAVFVVMNTSYFTRDNLQRTVLGIQKAISGEEPDNPIVFEDSGNNSYGIFKGGLVILSDKSLSIYDASGFLLSETGINFYDPVLRVSDDYLLCFDRGGTGLLVFDSFGIVRQKSFRKEEYEYSILDAQFGFGGKISVITDAPNSKGIVYVYSGTLEEIYEFSSVDAYPVRADVQDKNVLSVVALSPRKELTDLLFYRIDYQTGDGYQVPVYSAEDRFPVSFCPVSGGLEVLTDTDLLLAGKDGLSVSLKSLSSATDRYDLSEKYSMFSSLISASGRMYSLNCFDDKGNLLFSKEFYDLRDFACGNGRFFVLAENQLYFLDKSGTILSTVETESSAGKIVAADTVYVVGTGTAEKIDIPSASVKEK